MQDPAIKLTHLFLHATAFINVRLPCESAATAWAPLTIRCSTETFDYSRVKFVVHYFLGGSLSESDHSLLNSAGTAARTARTRTACWRWWWARRDQKKHKPCAPFSAFARVIFNHCPHSTKSHQNNVTHSTEWCYIILFIPNIVTLLSV